MGTARAGSQRQVAGGDPEFVRAANAHLAAKKVYEFLKVADKISIRYRPVGHIPSNEDLLDFADHVFFGKPLSEEFGKLAYPEEKNGFAWEASK